MALYTEECEVPQRRRGPAALAVFGAALVVAGSRSASSSSVDATGFALPSTPAGALRGTSAATSTSMHEAPSAAGSGAGVAATLATAGAAAAMLARAGTAAAAPRSRGSRVVVLATKLEDLSVGDEFDATVRRVAKIGIWVDIGAEKEALLPAASVPKGKKFNEGDVIPGVKITEVQAGSTPAERKIRVAAEIAAPEVTPEVGGIYEAEVLRSAKFGVFFDIKAGNDVLAPTQFLDKAPTDYAPGTTMKVKVVKVEGDRITVSTDLEGKVATMDGLEVGKQVTGTVATVNPSFGIFFNIGAPRDALCRTNQLSKPLAEYSVGEKIEGLTISNVNLEKQQVEVTTRKLAVDVEVGDKLEGTVATVADYGVFFDAGLSTDVLAPSIYLSKAASEYAVGEIADLTVFKVDGNKISVTTKAEDEMGVPLSKMIRGSEVTGTVVRMTDAGVFFDVGSVTAALCRAGNLPKDKSEYKVGDEQEGLIVTQINEDAGQIEVSSRAALSSAASADGGSGPTRLMNLTVGQEVEGTVKRAAPFGVFVDIGAERDALWAASQLDKPSSEYQPGEKITGLKITECNPSTQRLAVSTRKSAAEFSVGDEVTGTVTKIMAFGVFVNIGASTEALAPARLLEKEPSEYQVGEELTGLKIAQLDVDNNKISVSQGDAAGGAAAGSTAMSDLKVGSTVSGVVRKSMDYGVFVDIGLGRTDALLPRGLMGEDRTPESYKPDEKIEVFIANVDTQKNRVTLSLKEPDASMGGPKIAQVGKGGLPADDMFPDAKMWNAKQGGGDDSLIVDDEGIPWKDWETKYPGLIKFPKQEVELYLTAKGMGFSGVDEAAQSEPAYIPIPVHLRKPDAAAPEIPEFSFDDYELGYEYGIKPEIHTKFRAPPLNDPNWTNKKDKKVAAK